MKIAKVDKRCETCKGYLKYGSLCEDLRHVIETDPEATYISTKASDSCEYWIASPLLKSVEVGARPGYRTQSAVPEMFDLEPESTNDR